MVQLSSGTRLRSSGGNKISSEQSTELLARTSCSAVLSSPLIKANTQKLSNCLPIFCNTEIHDTQILKTITMSSIELSVTISTRASLKRQKLNYSDQSANDKTRLDLNNSSEIHLLCVFFTSMCTFILLRWQFIVIDYGSK